MPIVEHRMQAYDAVLPVVSGSFVSAEPPASEVLAVHGTAFPIGGDAFITAAHVLEQALQHEAQALGHTTGREPWRMWQFQDHESLPDADIGVIRVRSVPTTLPMRWTLDELYMLTPVQTCGYPYALDTAQRCLHIRAFTGHICAPRSWPGFAARPRVYELDFPSPRGLSGAPLWTTDNPPMVAGVLFGNSITDMTIWSETETESDASGRKTEIHVREALHLGLALQTSAFINLESRILGCSLASHLARHGLLT